MRRALAFAGIVLAAAMAGAAAYAAFALHTGWERSADRADLADVVARFAPDDPARVGALLRALPNVEAVALRFEATDVRAAGGDGRSRRGAVQLVDTGARRGYAVVAGRDLRRGAGEEVVLERGVADAWDVAVGDEVRVGRLGGLRVVGIAVGPDNVAFPLASAPRFYVARDWLERRFGARPGELAVSQALVWTRDPARTDVTLREARATLFGVRDLRFVTRAGVRVLVDQAAGIVIALLVAFSVVALLAAGILLGAQSAAAVQRRLQALGVQRALGWTPRRIVGEHAARAAVTGLVAGAAGVTLGALAVAGPADDLLRALNAEGPGAAALPWLALTVLAVAALVTATTAWPAWRAARRPPVGLLRGGELGAARPARAPRLGGFAGLGARLALARRGRATAAVAVLTASGAVVLLLVALASLLVALRDDPTTLGKRYQLTAALPADRVEEVRALPGVADAAPRYVVRAADSYALGEPVKLVAFADADRRAFEDPAADRGRAERAPGEAVIGEGLAAALGVAPGGTLAVQLPSGGEARFRVVGTVRALEDDGRIAYVGAPALLAADPGLEGDLAVRLEPGADREAVTAALRDLGARPLPVGGGTTRDRSFLGTLATLLRAVALLNGIVCLVALAQALALTARDRRPTLALLRAAGAPTRTILAVLAGAALVLAVPAALLAALVQRVVLAPLVGDLAAGYADLDAAATPGQVGLLLAGAVVAALLAAAVVARRVAAEPPVVGLREPA